MKTKDQGKGSVYWTYGKANDIVVGQQLVGCNKAGQRPDTAVSFNCASFLVTSNQRGCRLICWLYVVKAKTTLSSMACKHTFAIG